MSNNRTEGTADENKAVVAGSISHFRTYMVDGSGKTQTFQITACTFPNGDGAEQKRSFLISDAARNRSATSQ